MRSIEDLNKEIRGEIIADSEAKHKREMEEKIMQENLEIKKDPELEATNMSHNDSETQETIENIITQDEVKDNADEMYDPFGVMTERDSEETTDDARALSYLQESFQRTEVYFEDGKSYVAQVKDMKHRRIDDKNMDVLDLELKIFSDEKMYKTEDISFFFSSNRYCVENSIEKLKELSEKFSFKLKQEDFYSFDTIINAFEHLHGIWVKVKGTTRIEKILGKPDKKYMNFEVAEVLGKNYDLGGNL